jgi:predicted ATPase
MEGFSLRDSASFDDWQLFQAESLRRDLASALMRLVRCCADRHEYQAAIAHGRRLLLLDTLNEPAHRLLMELYAWSGQRSAAMHQYRECERVLQKELGVAPLEETLRLYATIRDHQVVAPPEPARQEPAPAARPAEQLALTGRQREWDALQSAYAAGANGRLIVIEGEAGVGKTRLAEELLAHARSAGAAVLPARCYEGETTLAFGLFVEWLRAVLQQPQGAERLRQVPAHWLAEAARLLPELVQLRPDGAPAPPLDSPGAQARFFEGLSQVMLAACAGGAPGLLFLDDAHWADAASLDLLAYLSRRLQGRPLCLLISWRGDDLPADHRLRLLLADALRARQATVIVLTRLSRADVLRLAQAMQLDLALGERLYAETEGLALFVAEYLAALAQQAAEPAGDAWRVPGTVRALLHSRLATLGETAAQALAAAAVIGRSFDFDTLRAASGRSEDETVTALEELLARGMVRELQQPLELRYDFSHEKLRSLVYDQTSLVRRRLLHRRVAEALRTRRGSGDALAGQIGQHLLAAGNTAEAADYFRQAGQHARGLFANAEALAHFRTALALGHPAAAAIHEAIGDLLTLRGEYSAALDSYAQAAPSWALERKRAGVHLRRGEWQAAELCILGAIEALGAQAGPAQRAGLLADHSMVSHRQGKAAQATALARQALELAERDGDPRALAEAHNLLGLISASQDDHAAAATHLERSLELANAAGDVDARVAALNNLALSHNARGDPARALGLVEQAIELCVARGDRHHEAALRNTAADLLYAAGRGDAAMAQLKQAVAIFAEIGVEAGEMRAEIWRLVDW